MLTVHRAAALVAVLLAATSAAAHPMPGSTAALDLHADGVAVEIRMPLGELEVAFGSPLAANPAQAVARHRDALAAYVGRHVRAMAPDGRPWTTTVRRLALTDDAAPELLAEVWLAPPPGAPVRRFTLNYDAVVHQLVTHVTLLSVRSDWDTGVLASQPDILGEVRFNRTRFEIDRTAGSVWRGLARAVRLGMHHIADGTDHLLFLLTLLLPAVLVAQGRRRWGGPAGARRSARHLAGIVTAFTVGHSLTLILGATGVLRAPSRPVEVLVAVSILVSALHAVRPLFPRREALVAGAFGLVHGLAFSTVVAGFGLDPWHTALSVFGFNVGVELMQLAVVAVTVPWLMILAAQTPVYTPIRLAGAAVAGVAALGWLGERAFGLHNPVGPLVEGMAGHALWIVAALAAGASVAAWTARRAARRPREAVAL